MRVEKTENGRKQESRDGKMDNDNYIKTFPDADVNIGKRVSQIIIRTRERKIKVIQLVIQFYRKRLGS